MDSPTIHAPEEARSTLDGAALRARDPVRARTLVAACVVALVAVAVAHGGALSNGFVGFDDPNYILDNDLVRAGLTRDSLAKAFTFVDRAFYFHPLAWLSLMADRQIFGPGPWGFHLTNLVLHATTVVILLLALTLASGRAWTSLGAVLLFGVHPLTVEAVAWASERKTVLAGALGAAAVLAYVAYARKGSAARLVATTVLHASSLLAKPALVVLPALLLVLDHWPLRRIAWRGGDAGGRGRNLRALLIEKIPMAFVSLASVAVSMASNEPYGVPDWEPPGGRLRVANAIASIPAYLRAALWPANLSVFHPYPRAVPAGAVLLGFAVIVLASAGAIAAVRRTPAVLAGWVWFAVALLPALGLVQNGLWPAWADRFSYFALWGLAAGASFALADLTVAGPIRRAAGAAAVGVAVVALCLATRAQVGHWKDSTALFERAVAIEPGSGIMQYDLGKALLEAGSYERALEHLEIATRIHPRRFEMQTATGLALEKLARMQAAEERYRIAIGLNPVYPAALYNLAEVLRRTWRMDEALPFYARFLGAAPANLEPQRSLAEARLVSSQQAAVPRRSEGPPR